MKEISNGIGILGGTFNPIHYGHLRMALEVLNALKLEKILFIPTGNPPHKNDKFLVSPQKRYEMVKLAIAHNSKFHISDIETKREKTSYTVDTLRMLKKIYPNKKLYFIIGSDTVSQINTWKDYKQLLKLCRFVMVDRPRYNAFKNYHEFLLYKERYKLICIKSKGFDISSTEIRNIIVEGISAKYLIPEVIEQYIIKHKLYR